MQDSTPTPTPAPAVRRGSSLMSAVATANNLRGIGLMMLAGLLFAFQQAGVQAAADAGVHPFEIGFFRAAIGFTGPISATVLAALVLGETVRLRRWTAIVAGCACIARSVRVSRSRSSAAN